MVISSSEVTDALAMDGMFMDNRLSELESVMVGDAVWRYHSHAVAPNECSSILLQHIRAPVAAVWSIVRRFDEPQAYKHFIRTCSVASGDVAVGTTREVTVVSGLPAKNSTERLEILNEEEHVLSFRVLGGDHRLQNYKSVTSLHEILVEDGRLETVVIESYVVDIPPGNTREETRMYTNTLVKCNLRSLARIAEHRARHAAVDQVVAQAHG